MYRERFILITGVLLVTVMAGCILGPQPEPPDVTDSPTADVDEAFNGRFYDEGSDEAVDIGDYDGDECPCEPGLAGGEWNCDDDRDGHEPPFESDDGAMASPTGRAVLSDPRTRFFDDEDEPEPTDATHFDTSDDDDDGIGVIDD